MPLSADQSLDLLKKVVTVSNSTDSSDSGDITLTEKEAKVVAEKLQALLSNQNAENGMRETALLTLPTASAEEVSTGRINRLQEWLEATQPTPQEVAAMIESSDFERAGATVRVARQNLSFEDLQKLETTGGLEPGRLIGALTDEEKSTLNSLQEEESLNLLRAAVNEAIRLCSEGDSNKLAQGVQGEIFVGDISWNEAQRDPERMLELFEVVVEMTNGEERKIPQELPEGLDYQTFRSQWISRPSIEAAAAVLSDVRTLGKVQGKLPKKEDTNTWLLVFSGIYRDVQEEIARGDSVFSEGEEEEAFLVELERYKLLKLYNELGLSVTESVTQAPALQKEEGDQEQEDEEVDPSEEGFTEQQIAQIPAGDRMKIIDFCTQLSVQGGEKRDIADISADDVTVLRSIARLILKHQDSLGDYLADRVGLSQRQFWKLLKQNDVSLLSEEETVAVAAIEGELEDLKALSDGDDFDAFEERKTDMIARVVVLRRLLKLLPPAEYDKRVKAAARIFEEKPIAIARWEQRSFPGMENYELTPDLFTKPEGLEDEFEGDDFDVPVEPKSGGYVPTKKEAYRAVNVHLDDEGLKESIPPHVRDLLLKISADNLKLLNALDALKGQGSIHAQYLRRSIGNNNRYIEDILDAVLSGDTPVAERLRGYRNIMEALAAGAYHQDFGDLPSEKYDPVLFLPGSAGKLDALEQRAMNGEPLFHPDDEEGVEIDVDPPVYLGDEDGGEYQNEEESEDTGGE